MAKRKPPASHVLKRGQRQKAQEEQEDTRRGRRTEPARLHPNQAREEPSRASDATWRDSRESERSRTKSLARHKAKLARTPKGRASAVRAVSRSPVGSPAEDAQPSRKGGSRRDAPSLPACKPPTRRSLTPGCGILRSQLHAQHEQCAEVARCEVGACPE